MLMTTGARAMTFALLSLIAGSTGGYLMGLNHGRLTVQATANRTTIDALTTLLEQYTQLVHDANAASTRLNVLIAQRQTHDYTTTKTLREVLNETAALRTDCRFDYRVVHELTAARNRAAKTAASGVTGAMPSTD